MISLYKLQYLCNQSQKDKVLLEKQYAHILTDVITHMQTSSKMKYRTLSSNFQIGTWLWRNIDYG